MMNNTKATVDPLRSVRRTTLLLRLLSTHTATGWRLTDLAQETALHHSTVHRLVNCLMEERLAVRIPGSLRYSLGPMAYELGLAAAPHFELQEITRSRLTALAARTRDIVFLSVMSGNDSVCIGRWDGRRALKAYTVHVGTRRALSLSAGGVAMLIELPAAARTSIIKSNMDSISRRGEARVAAVRRMFTRSHLHGYGFNQEDIIPGIGAVGVSFGRTRHEPVGALSIAASLSEMTEARRQRLVDLLRTEAALIGESLARFRY
jgi:DNA-binding IclR family transcriptional regulator